MIILLKTAKSIILHSDHCIFILSHDQLKKKETGRARDTYGEKDRNTQGFGGEA